MSRAQFSSEFNFFFEMLVTMSSITINNNWNYQKLLKTANLIVNDPLKVVASYNTSKGRCWLYSNPQATGEASSTTHNFIPTLSIRDILAKLLTLHLRNIHFPSFSTTPTHASAPYNAVGTITASYTSSHLLWPILYCSANFSALPTLYAPHSSMYHIPFTAYIRCHLRPHVLKAIYNL